AAAFDSIRRARATAERTAAQLNEAGVELERNAQQLAQAVDGMSDALFVFDAEWRLVIFNAAAGALLRRMGRDPSSLFGKVIWSEFPHLIGSPVHEELIRVQRQRQIFERELPFEPANLWLSIRTVPTP